MGRGDLVSSEDLLSVLGPAIPALQSKSSDPSDSSDASKAEDKESERHLLGIAIDVTDPEPLPTDHPLYTHPRAIITPHTSGNFVGYVDAATDLLVANVEHMRKGGKAFNLVDPKKGY